MIKHDTYFASEMSSAPLPPNPCLVAILLVVKFYNEPQIVFHYPPRPGEDNSHYTDYLSADLTDDDSTSSSDEESTKSSDERSKSEAQKVELNKGDNSPDADVDETGSASPEKHDGVNPARKPRWDDIFGFPSAMLAKLLCPASSNHKKRFEMGIDEKVFVGWPVYKRAGRGWQRKRKPRKSRSTDNHSEVKKSLREGATSGRTSALASETSGQGSETEADRGKQKDRTIGDDPRSKDTSAQPHEGRKDTNGSKDTPETKSKDIMDMFNVVFVVDPPPLEYHLRVDEMYSNVVKKFARALKWEQSRCNYVAREASTICVLNRSRGMTV